MHFILSIYLFIFSIFVAAPTISLEPSRPILIFLKGTCSSGKSSLIKALECSRKEPNDLVIIDEDSLAYDEYLKAIIERFPTEYALISNVIEKDNIYPALRTDKILFKKTANQESCCKVKKIIPEIQAELNNPQNLTWKQEISRRISLEALTEISTALKNKKHVLIDSWKIEMNQLQEMFPQTPIIRVMLYCSLPVAYERLQKRNSDAIAKENYSSARFYGQLFGSFCTLYEVSRTSIQPIQLIHKHDLDKIFDQIYPFLTEDNSSKPIFTFKEISRSELKTLHKSFMQPFDTSQSEFLYICPKEKYDFIIDNTNNDVQNSLKAIQDILEREVKNEKS